MGMDDVPDRSTVNKHEESQADAISPMLQDEMQSLASPVEQPVSVKDRPEETLGGD